MAGRSALKRLRVYVEPNGSYSVDGSGTIANFGDLRFDSCNLTRTVDVLPDNTVQQRIHKRMLQQFGFKRWTMDFSGALVSTNEALTNGVTATKDTLSKVLEAMVGGYNAGQGSIAASGISATGLTVDAGDGAQFIPGTIMGVETSTADRYTPAKIKTRSTDAVTFATSVGFSAASNAKLLNSQLIYPAAVLPSAATSLQFLYECEDRDNIWLAMGGQGTLGISWPLGGEAMWSCQFSGGKWLHDDDIATPLTTSSTLTAATFTGSAPIPVVAGSAVLTPISGTTRTLPTIDEIQLNTGISWQIVPSHNGVEGIAQMSFVRGEQPTLTMKVRGDDETWTDVRNDQTKYQFIAQAGNIAGRMLVLECGTMQLIAEPVMEEKNGEDWWSLTWGLLEDENCDDAGSDLERAPWRLARM
jgi:hypothetical protein